MSNLDQQLIGSRSGVVPTTQSSAFHHQPEPRSTAAGLVDCLGPSTPSTSSSSTTLEAIMELLARNNETLNSFMDRQNKSNAELNAKLDSIERIKIIVGEHSARITDLEADNEENKLTIARLETENAKLMDDITKLKTSVPGVPVPDSAEVSISGIPASVTDSSHSIVSRVLEVLGVPQLVSDVLDLREVIRKAPQKPEHAALSQRNHDNIHQQKSSRLLIVRFKSSQISYHVIGRKRIKGPVTIAEISSSQQPGHVYINEFLHPSTYILLRKTKDRASRMGWKYVWTREGRICARKHDGASIVYIAREEDLEKLD